MLQWRQYVWYYKLQACQVLKASGLKGLVHALPLRYHLTLSFFTSRLMCDDVAES